MKKSVLLLVVILLMTSVFAGCTGEGEKTDNDSAVVDQMGDSDESVEELEPVVIEFWFSAAEDESDVVYKFQKENMELFTELHPNVTFETFILGGNSGEDYKTKLFTEAATGNVPDVFMTWHGATSLPLIESGLVMPIDELVANNQELSSILDRGTLAMCTYDGVLYGIPDTVDAIGLFYNKGIYDSLNLEVPTTYEELLEQNPIMQENGITPIAFGINPTNWMAQIFWEYIFMQENGQDKYNSEIMTGTYDFTEQEYIDALQVSVDMGNAGIYGDNFGAIAAAEAKAKFTNGEAAMLLQGTWSLSGLYDVIGDDLGYMTFPSYNGNAVSSMVAASKGYSLAADAPKEAIEFFEFIYSAERQKAYAEMGVFVPTKVEYDSSQLPSTMNEVSKVLGESTNTFIIWNDLIAPGVKADLGTALQDIHSGADIAGTMQNIMDIKTLEE